MNINIYDELQQAYNFFNEKLFENHLPGCIITLQRKANTRGYFSAERFVLSKARKTFVHEISINPTYFSISSSQQILSTLVHEMVHLLCFLNGTSGKKGYHNKKWVIEMEKIGLIPSNTGKEGGKKTGYSVSHYIAPMGSFANFVKVLCEEKGFFLSCYERFMLEYLDKSAIQTFDIPVFENFNSIEFSNTGTCHFFWDITVGIKTIDDRKGGKRMKYSCACSSVWGKGDLELFCTKCNCVMTSTNVR